MQGTPEPQDSEVPYTVLLGPTLSTCVPGHSTAYITAAYLAHRPVPVPVPVPVPSTSTSNKYQVPVPVRALASSPWLLMTGERKHARERAQLARDVEEDTEKANKMEAPKSASSLLRREAEEEVISRYDMSYMSVFVCLYF